MANDSTAQQPLTRRELRELERQAQHEARLAELAAEREAAARAARIEAERAAEAVVAEVEPAAPAFRSRRERREAEAAAAIAAPAPVVGGAPVVDAVAPVVEAAPAPVKAAPAPVEAAEPVAPVFLSRRERRKAERAAELAVVARIEAESAAAVAKVAVELPELFAAPAPAVDHAPAVAAPVELAEAAAPVDDDPAPSIRPVVSVDAERALRRAAAGELPIAPNDEPELEIAAAFARQGRAVGDTRAVRARRIMLDNRRSASAGRFGGSLLAMSFLAGTVVLGTGSAAAIGVIGAQHGEAEAQDELEALPEAQGLTVASSETLAVSAERADEVTTVTSIGSAAAANLATGVKLPDAQAYTNDITANVQYPFPMGVQITDTYGPRISPTWGASSWHGGVDFTPGEGTPIGAIADGVVIAVDEGTSGYGVYVEVQHVIEGVQVVSIYAHLESGKVPVKVGDTVSVGDAVGTVGNTGVSTGPHLHLEVRVNGDTVDPMYFFEKLNVPGVKVELPTQLVAPNATGAFEKLEQAESHALIDRLFVAR